MAIPFYAPTESFEEPDLIRKYPKSDLVPEARFLIGMVDWIEGQKTRARETWRILTRDFPQHPRSVQAQLYLKEKP